MSVGVEGVPFDVEDAREFGERTRRYQHPTALAGAASLAAQLEERVEQGGGDLLPLTNEEKIAASPPDPSRRPPGGGGAPARTSDCWTAKASL
jgi:hypothetical protein